MAQFLLSIYPSWFQFNKMASMYIFFQEQLEYLIFNAREIPIIKQYLFQSEDILMYRAEQGYDIFSLVLDKYINLSEFDTSSIVLSFNET